MITLDRCRETLEQLIASGAGAEPDCRFVQDGTAGLKSGWSEAWEPYWTALEQLKRSRQSGDTALLGQALEVLGEIAGRWQQEEAMTQAVYIWILTEASRCLDNAADYMRLAQDIADVRIRADRAVEPDTAAAVAAALMALPYKHMPKYVPAFLRHAYIYHARYWAKIGAEQQSSLTDAGRFFLRYGLQRLMDERKGYRW